VEAAKSKVNILFELAKYESWEASNKSIKRLIDKYNFDKVDTTGGAEFCTS